MKDDSEETGMKIKVRVYILQHDGDDFDSRWEAIYSTAQERDEVLAQALDESYVEEFQGDDDWRKPKPLWATLTVLDKVDWYFDWINRGGQGHDPVEWDYEQMPLVYDVADIEVVK